MKSSLGLCVLLTVLWLALSGYFKPVLIGLGVASVLLVVFLGIRMRIVDDEGYPLKLQPLMSLRYVYWLVGQVFKSNVAVARRIWSSDMGLSPVVFRVESSQKTKLGQVIYANSITLTPGTVSINLWDGVIRVHALTEEGARELAGGEMNTRVAKIEGD